MEHSDSSHNRTLPNTSAAASPATADPYIRPTKLTLYAVIFVISSIGNTLVCLVIMKKKKMKTVTNYFILNLAIADLLLTFVCIPFDIPVQEMHHVWPYGALGCKLLYPLQTTCLYASVFTLTAVSLTRYWAIVHPLRQQLTVSRAKFVIVIIWLLSVIPVSPYIHVLQHKGLYCEEFWPNTTSRKIYTMALFMTQYVIPLGIILIAYLSIGAELRIKRTSDNRFLRSRQGKETAKVVRMLVVVTVVFAVCVLPTNIMWLWLDFGNAEEEFAHFWDLVAFCNILTFCNSAANPVCYTALNDNYRKYIKRFLARFFHFQGSFDGSFSTDEIELTKTLHRSGTGLERSSTRMLRTSVRSSWINASGWEERMDDWLTWGGVVTEKSFRMYRLGIFPFDQYSSNSSQRGTL